MRLLNINTLLFGEFSQGATPEYVILSHRWDDNETSFKEYCKNQNTTGAGYRKIIEFCNFVRDEVRLYQSNSISLRRCVEWVWINTCK